MLIKSVPEARDFKCNFMCMTYYETDVLFAKCNILITNFTLFHAAIKATTMLKTFAMNQHNLN